MPRLLQNGVSAPVGPGGACTTGGCGRPLAVLPRGLVSPFGDEQVGVALCRVVAVACEYQEAPTRREHREAVKLGAVGDAFDAGAVFVDDEQLELSKPGVVTGLGEVLHADHVAREDDALVVGQPERTEVGGAVSRDALEVAAVAIADGDLHVRWLDDLLAEQGRVRLGDFGVLREG